MQMDLDTNNALFYISSEVEKCKRMIEELYDYFSSEQEAKQDKIILRDYAKNGDFCRIAYDYIYNVTDSLNALIEQADIIKKAPMTDQSTKGQ